MNLSTRAQSINSLEYLASIFHSAHVFDSESIKSSLLHMLDHLQRVNKKIIKTPEIRFASP